MNEEKKNKLRIFIIYLLVFIVSIIFELFICKTAFAKELLHPYTSFNNGTPQSPQIYYGYSLPTRPTGNENDNKVHLNLSYCPDNQSQGCTSYLSDSYYFYKRDLDSEIINFFNENNVNYESWNIPTVWTDTITYDPSPEYFNGGSFGVGGSLTRDYYTFAFGFQPGGITDNINDVVSNGFSIDYNTYYSYTFDIVMYNENSLYYDNSQGMSNSFWLCKYNFNNDFSCSYNSYNDSLTLSNQYIGLQELYNDSNLQYFRITMPVNMYQKWGFSQSVVFNPSSPVGADGNYIISFVNDILMRYSDYNNESLTKVLISEPYNITLWATEDSITCIDSCWTQDDTNNNQRYDNPAQYSTNLFYNTILNLNYHGFSGIVNLTYDFIVRILQSSNNNICNGLNIPILSTSITLPSSCIFWNRQDISSFESFTNMLWLGVVSYFIAWRIYKDILKVYDPDSKLIDGNEVADL